ncbi:MAG: virulence factor MviN [Desulfuromonadales bacterium]|nr:virulence factor MviN [Desulfuromonadales bacterium]
MIDRIRHGKTWINATTNRKIFAAAVLIIICSVFARVAATVKEIAVASYFGAGDNIDAFLMAFLVPAYVINVIGASFNAALIPSYIRIREQQGTASAHKLFSNVMAGCLAMLIAASVVILAGAPYYLPLVASGFSREKVALTGRLLCFLSPMVVLCGINTLWGAILNADRKFGLVAATPVVTPLVVILFLISGRSDYGVYSLAIGTICGMLMELILLGIALTRKGISPWPRWYGLDSNVRQVFRQLVPMVSGASLMCATGFIDQSMSSMLGSGSVSALSYGNKIVSALLGLSATALGTAVTPYFSTMVARREWAEIRHTLKHYYRLIMLTSVPITIVLIFSSEPLVRLLYQRGAFTQQNTHLVAQVQSLLALQIPFYLAATLTVRLISTMMANQILVIGSIINVIVSVSLNYIFMQTMGVCGIALSTSCVYAVSFLFLYYSWRWTSRHGGTAASDDYSRRIFPK